MKIRGITVFSIKPNFGMIKPSFGTVISNFGLTILLLARIHFPKVPVTGMTTPFVWDAIHND